MDIINIHLPIFHNKFLKKCIAAGGEKNKINEIFGMLEKQFKPDEQDTVWFVLIHHQDPRFQIVLNHHF